LRRELGERLPEHMVPSVFVVLDALPLNANGKVDRQSLPAPSGARPELDTEFVAPRTPVEAELARIWAEVLQLDAVGVDDHFLELGGHSLLATHVVSRVIHRFAVDVPLRALFEAPTVAAMAVVIVGQLAMQVGAEEMSRVWADVEGARPPRP
jgi:acyl carrier protein